MILVVDDHEDTRVLLVKVLTLDGFKAGSAATADEALKRLEIEPVTCLVVDYQMPQVDGIELARRVRSDPRWSRLKIVLFSGYDAQLPADVGSAGIDAVIVKARQNWKQIIDAVEHQCTSVERTGVHWGQWRTQPRPQPPTLGAG